MTAADSRVVLDASVVVDLLFPDVDLGAPAVTSIRVLSARGVTFVGPTALPVEVRNALLTGIRKRRWDGAAADRAMDTLTRLPLTIVGDDRDVPRAWELARRHDNHPIYDMVYVALAERLGVPLLTLDDKLRRRLAHVDWVLSPADIG